jgi:site-specific DNA recombinase
MKARNPRVKPPRVASGPVSLTGLAVCAPSCDGAMTSRTGTSRNGKVHRYYSCSTCNRQGKAACKDRSIRMDKLDALANRGSQMLACGNDLWPLRYGARCFWLIYKGIL